jgi:C-terminal processing protease CtpA/Prc
VTSVVPLGPSALAREVAPGDTIAAIDGQAVTPRTNLDERLANTIDRRVVLSVKNAAGTVTRGHRPADVSSD